MTRLIRVSAAGESHRRDHQGDQTDGDVDVEDPPPRGVLHEQTADQRTDDRRDAEHGHEQAHVPATLAWRHHVAQDGLRPDHEAAPAQALEEPEEDQLQHGVAQTGEGGAEEEDDDRELEEHLAAVEVAELAPEGRRRPSTTGGRRSRPR